MKIFVYEHVTGGGMVGKALPPRLLYEADLMVRTLLGDLLSCPGATLLTTRDARLPPVPGIETLVVGTADDREAIIARAIEAADAVWPTAPETGGALEQMAASVLQRGRVLLGSRPDAVRIATSKMATARALHGAGIPTVETFATPQDIRPLAGRWVTKPDDGAGAEGAQLAPDWRSARDRLAAAGGGLVAQPWMEGEPLSLSLLCADGESALLSCNRQCVRVAGDQIILEGIDVNALGDDRGTFARIGRAIASALPGLWGYVGVDLIMTDGGALVVDVNPRLTTSYCGLQRALGISVAAQVMGLLQTGSLPRWRPAGRGTMVHLTLEAGSA